MNPHDWILYDIAWNVGISSIHYCDCAYFKYIMFYHPSNPFRSDDFHYFREPPAHHYPHSPLHPQQTQNICTNGTQMFCVYWDEAYSTDNNRT